MDTGEFRQKKPGLSQRLLGTSPVHHYPEGTRTVFIHIGKCGGATVKAGLRTLPDAEHYAVAHVTEPPYRPDLSYVILCRAPLSRAISAFNWRRRLVLEEGQQPKRFPGEAEVLKKYGTISALAEALFDDQGAPNVQAHADALRIHHIRENISFYLTRLLAQCEISQIKAVLMQETLDADMARVFGIQNDERIHDNSAKAAREELSAKAKSNLRAFLHKDYEALATLYAWGKIDRETFIRTL